MSKDSAKFAIFGTGNSGQAFAADLSLKDFSVNLTEVPEFESNLRVIDKKGGIEISGEAGNGFAKLNMITNDIKEAVKGVDIIIIGGSALAQEPLSRMLAPYFEDGQFILFTSNFGALRFKKLMKELNITTDVTPVETLSLPYATRAVKPGEVVVTAVKRNLLTAALPAGRTKDFLTKTNPALPCLTAAENVFVTSLGNFNPIIHPPITLCNSGRIESTGGKGWNFYADGPTESVAKLMLSMDKERISILSHLGLREIPLKDTFEDVYKDYSVGGSTMSWSETLRKSPVHTNPIFPPPSNLGHRYVTEDLPYGLVPWSSIAHIWGLPTPTIDAIIQIYSAMSGVDYFKKGVTAEDIGLYGLTPEEAIGLVV